MSSADPTEVSVVVTGDGVTVEKSFEPDDFPVPAIAFVVQSGRDERVTVRLTDSVPDGVSPEDIGFHPKYGAEHWSVTGDRIVFEREFEPGEEYTTVYGLRSDTDDIEAYLEEPELESVDPPLQDDGQTVGEPIDEEDEDSDTTGDADSDAAGDADDEEDVPSLDLRDPGEGEGVESAVESVDADEDVADADGDTADAGEDAADADEVSSLDADQTDADQTDEFDESVAGGSAATPADTDDIVAALAAEIRSGDASDEDVQTLQETFGGSEGSATTDARIKRLQTEVADLSAYADELETFLNKAGNLEQGLSDVRNRVDDVESQTDAVDDRSSENAERIESVDADLTAVDDEIATAAERAEQALDRAEIAEETATAAESEIDTLNEEITAVREEFDTVYDDVDDLRERADGIESELDDVAEDAKAVPELTDSLDDLESELQETRDDLTDRLEDVDEEIESLTDMRDRLTSAFGPISDQADENDGE